MVKNRFELADVKTRPPASWTYWAVEGLLLAGPYPGAPHPDESREKLGILLEAGITTFVNLMEANETNRSREPFVPYDVMAQQLASPTEVRCVRYAIADRSIPSKETMHLILDEIDQSLSHRRPVYLHCWGGVGRTGTVMGCWLLRHGLATTDTVIKTIQVLRLQDKHRGDRDSPENAMQRSFVESWAEEGP